MTKHFLSICAIVKNEAAYLPEWIEFHRLQGVEHFYIYHNAEPLEDIETEKILEAEIENERGDVSWIVWPGKAQQMPAYNHFLLNYGHETEWCGFTDIDEFLFCPNWPTVKEFLKAALTWEEMALDDNEYKDWKGLAGLAVSWVLFGSNGEKEKRDGLVIERFTTRAAVSDKHVKSVLRPEFIQSTGNDPHCFYVRNPKTSRIVNERGESMPRDYALHGRGAGNIIRINHYHTKSFGEYLERRRNPDAGSGRAATPEWLKEKFKAHDLNEVRDFTVRDRYAQKIKDALCR